MILMTQAVLTAKEVEYLVKSASRLNFKIHVLGTVDEALAGLQYMKNSIKSNIDNFTYDELNTLKDIFSKIYEIEKKLKDAKSKHTQEVKQELLKYLE